MSSWTSDDISSDDRSTLDPDYILTSSESTMSESFFDLSLEEINNNYLETDPFNDSEEQVFENINMSELNWGGGMDRERVEEAQGGDGGPPKQKRSRHPTSNNADDDSDLMDPIEYLEANRNENTRKNEDVAMKTYERVMSRLSDRGGEDFVPLKEAAIERLPHLLQKFLQTAKKPDGKVYASGTLNTLFNGICNFLCARENEPVNIKSDVRFKAVLKMLKVQTSKSAMEGRGSGCDAKRAVTNEHLSSALGAGTIGRDAPKPLVTSVYLASVLGWGCRAGAECHMIQNQDLIFGPVNEKSGVNDWIELSERVTKTRKGNPGDERELVPKIFPDDEFPDTCHVRTVLEYQRRKTPAQKAPDSPFFLNTNLAATKNPGQFQFWYVGTGKLGSGIMGIHMLEKLVMDALKSAGVDCKLEKYSAISLRKSMLQSGVDCNVPDLHLSRLAGHKALVSKKAYVNSAGLHHQTTGRVIHRQLYHGVNRGYEQEMRGVGERKDTKEKKNRSRSRERRGRSKSKEKKNQSRSREKKKSRSRSKERRNRSGSKERRNRSRSRSKERRNRSRSRSKERRNRSRSKEKKNRSRSMVKNKSNYRGRMNSSCSNSSSGYMESGRQKSSSYGRLSGPRSWKKSRERSRKSGKRRIKSSSRCYTKESRDRRGRVSRSRDWRKPFSRSRDRSERFRRTRSRSYSTSRDRKRDRSSYRSKYREKRMEDRGERMQNRKGRERRSRKSRSSSESSSSGSRKQKKSLPFSRTGSSSMDVDKKVEKLGKSTSSTDEWKKRRCSSKNEREGSPSLRRRTYSSDDSDQESRMIRSSSQAPGPSHARGNPTLTLAEPEEKSVEQYDKMFECLDKVPDANEAEIETALKESEWVVTAAIKILKINELFKCPVKDWTFGFSKNRAVCRVVLDGLDWDLGRAKCKVMKVKSKSMGSSKTPLNAEEFFVSNTQSADKLTITTQSSEQPTNTNQLLEGSTKKKSLSMEASTNTTQSLQQTSSNNLSTNKEQAKAKCKRGKENNKPVSSIRKGDILFHKLTGHPPWPVQVTGVSDKGRPELLYWGTREVGTAKQSLTDLYPYNNNTKAAFNSYSIRKLKTALAEADLLMKV